jgi:hypothetical protein
MDKNELKKYLYRNKDLTASFRHYKKGNLYYTVQLEDGLYQFPIATFEVDFAESNDGGDEIKILKLSEDLGETPFDNEIKASLLIRWIDKAIIADKFDKI